MGRSILCLARASPSCIALRAGSLLAAPFGPLAMCFLRTSQRFGWHDPLSSCAAAIQGQGSVAVGQSEVGHR
jgi:hypothetical protein